jgi:outer membrane murein-binding lipoprotein Lpp
MKRLLLCGAVVFCSILSGCSSNPQADAIAAVQARMGDAANNIKNIADEVDNAVKKHEQNPKVGLDLTEASKLTEALKETGKKAQEIKVKQIEQIKVATAEKDELRKEYETTIRNAFSELVKARENLNKSLQKAEAIDSVKTDELRTKIREAEGPFETLARQG